MSAARLLGVEKSFGSVQALDGASLTLEAGSVHGVLGENGAGKSTLLGVLGGSVVPDAGVVEIGGATGWPGSPVKAREHGVGFVHQHFRLVGSMTLLENFALASPLPRFSLPLARVRGRVRELERLTGWELDLSKRSEELSIGDRQRAEVLKALVARPRVLVLDEPTAVLAPPEIAPLFDLLRRLAAEGLAIALVGHKLDEVAAVADRFTVLRRGRSVLETAALEAGDDAEAGPVSRELLADAMVGGASAPSWSDEPERFPRSAAPGGPRDPTAPSDRDEPVRLSPAVAADGPREPAVSSDAGVPVSGTRPAAAGGSRELSVPDDGSRTARSELHCPLAAGETARREEADARRESDHGRTDRTRPSPVASCRELHVRGPGGATALRGVSLEVARGEIVGVVGVEGNGQRELAQVMAGRIEPESGELDLPAAIGYIPQDRSREGIAAELSLVENIALARQRGSGRLLAWRELASETRALVRDFDVRAESERSPGGSLSGGNQQRLLVARELGGEVDLIVAANPTRGLDFNATRFVHETLRRLVSGPSPPGVLLITSDLDEVVLLSDRAFAMVRGRLIPEPGGERRARLGRLMVNPQAKF